MDHSSKKALLWVSAFSASIAATMPSESLASGTCSTYTSNTTYEAVATSEVDTLISIGELAQDILDDIDTGVLVEFDANNVVATWEELVSTGVAGELGLNQEMIDLLNEAVQDPFFVDLLDGYYNIEGANGIYSAQMLQGQLDAMMEQLDMLTDDSMVGITFLAGVGLAVLVVALVATAGAVGLVAGAAGSTYYLTYYGPNGDFDSDGIPNKNDSDIDNDGTPNTSDLAPYDPSAQCFPSPEPFWFSGYESAESVQIEFLNVTLFQTAFLYQ